MSDLQRMLIARRESLSVPTKREAGLVLAAGGWAVFPLPNLQKFDNGLSYLSATTDPARWHDMCEEVMHRHECHDVNIALAPGKCAVPLLVVDLDGTEAMWRFFNDAEANKHTDLGMWLRVNTTRADNGRHMYFVAPEGKQWGNSTHIWGGDVRSGRGHVVMPPSATELGTYTWAGENLYIAPKWVVEGLRGSTVGNATRDGEKSDEEIEELLHRWSGWPTNSYARAALNYMLADMEQARAGDQRGGRNPMLAKTINRVMDLAYEGQLNAMEAVREVTELYGTLFSPDEARSPSGEVVRCIRSWFRNHEKLEEGTEQTETMMAWAVQRGGGAQPEPVDIGNGQILPGDDRSDRPASAGSSGRPRRRVAADWRSKTNK